MLHENGHMKIRLQSFNVLPRASISIDINPKYMNPLAIADKLYKDIALFQCRVAQWINE